MDHPVVPPSARVSHAARALKPVNMSRLNQPPSGSAPSSTSAVKSKQTSTAPMIPLYSSMTGQSPPRDALVAVIHAFLWRFGITLPSGQHVAPDYIAHLTRSLNTFSSIHKSLWVGGLVTNPHILAQHLWASFPTYCWPAASDVPVLPQAFSQPLPPQQLNVQREKPMTDVVKQESGTAPNSTHTITSATQPRASKKRKLDHDLEGSIPPPSIHSAGSSARPSVRATPKHNTVNSSKTPIRQSLPQASIPTPPSTIPASQKRVASQPTRTQQLFGSTDTSSAAIEASQNSASAPVPMAPDAVGTNSSEPTLCKEQEDLISVIMRRRNVFYTGSAGCGKSTVLKAFVERIQALGKKVYILAPTGRAALAVNGLTTWTYAGWTPDSMKSPLEALKKRAYAKRIKQRMRDTDVLVFDEISMIENHHFERLNEVMKEVRGRSDLAFGGVHVVATGDFCQLPPVKPFTYCLYCGRTLQVLLDGQSYRCPQHGIFQDEDKWAFRSKAWAECKFEHRNLTTIHRQSDIIFIGILNKCRYGVPLSQADQEMLLQHPCKTTHAIRLYPTRQEVARINNAEFIKLRSRPRKVTCLDDFLWNEEHTELRSKNNRNAVDNSLDVLRDHKYDATVELKQGMLVVLLHNLSIDEGLVNGSQGVIVSFKKHTTADFQKTTKADSKKSGDYDSRKDVLLKRFVEAMPEQEWPVVRFTNGLVRPITAECSMSALGDTEPFSLISRTQIPLLAAWAMTVHKSQGMTLDRVIVNLSNSFEEGQVYVALSRARNLEGLKVEGLGDYQGGGNPQVLQFLKDKFKICM